MPGSAQLPPRWATERGLACEIVYVDDGSRDASLDVAQGLPADAADVQVVSLCAISDRSALLAGLDHASRGAVCSWTPMGNTRRR